VADIYGVTPADVAAELPGLYPNGFTAATKPTLATVTTLISEADAIASLRVQKATGEGVADPAAKSAALAKRFIKSWVKAEVTRIAYAGNSPRDVQEAAAPYEKTADFTILEIDALGEQAQDASGVPTSRVRGIDGSQVRDLLISDETLGYGARGGNRIRPW
jgi:hypothetical protein